MLGSKATLAVKQGTAVRSLAFRATTGDAVAWLEVGDRSEVAIHGSPAALRRVALEAVRAAEDAELLARRDGGRAAA
jgi:hypothetical protein